MVDMESYVTHLSYDELCQLDRIVKYAKLAYKPRIVADILVPSLYNDNGVVLEKRLNNISKAVERIDKALGKRYHGYRVRSFNGIQWELVKEGGETRYFSKLSELNKER